MADSGLAQAELRAGSRVLLLFANPLNVRVLRAHAAGPQRLADLREVVGWAPESTLRTAIANLSEVEAVERLPASVAVRGSRTALTPTGEDLLLVADALQAWLARFPAGPIPLDGEEAKTAVKALAGGWSSALLRELATKPTTLGDLNARLPDISYPALERRLGWMRMTGQIEAVEGDGRGIPYRPTEWLRRAIAPLTAAGRCERRSPAFDPPPVTNLEVEAALLLFLPLAPLPENAYGLCLMAVQIDSVDDDPADPELAGVSVAVEHGKIIGSSPDVPSDPPNWVVGSIEGWFDAVLDGRLDGLRLGGSEPQLALDLAAGLHLALSVED